MRAAKGIVLMCTPEGQIVDVVHDAWAVAERGNSLVSVVPAGDERKCHLFFEAIWREGVAFGWEMHVESDLLLFAGFVSSGLLFVIGTEEPAMTERLHVELTGMNSELTNALREAYKQQALARRSSSPSFDELVKLTHEMAAMHGQKTWNATPSGFASRFRRRKNRP